MRIAWEESARGEPLLLVHGLGYTKEGWGPVRDLLARSFRVLSFDNRGIGESEAPAGPYTVAQLADDALQVLDEAGVERAHLLGTSLGGFVAQEVAVRAPERVDRLVLACTMPGGPRSFPIPQPTLDLMARMGTMPPDDALRAFVVNALGDAPPDGLVDEIYAYRLAHQPPLDGWQAQAAAGAAFDGYDRMGDIRAPTLILTGLEDKVADPRNVQLLNDGIAGSRVELFPGCGHLFFWEQPERFAEVVTEFLR